MKKNKKTIMAIGVTVEEKECYKKHAEQKNITMSSYGRMSLKKQLEEGCNEPIVM